MNEAGEDWMRSEGFNPKYVLPDPPELTREIVRTRWREINTLLHSVALLHGELGGEDPHRFILRTSAAIASADRGLLYRWDESTAGIRLAGSLGTSGRIAEPLVEENSQARACFRMGKPVLVTDPAEPPLRGELAALGTRSVLSVPITHQGSAWRVLQLLRDRPFLVDEAILLWMYAMVLEGTLPLWYSTREFQVVGGRTDPRSG